MFQTSADAGPVLTGVVDRRTPRSFRLTWDPAYPSQVVELIRLVTEDALNVLTWTPPGEVTALKVILSPPKVEFAPLSVAAVSANISIEELLTTD